MGQSSPPVFLVRRQEPELVMPAKPNPHEEKLLSDIDDQQALRYHIPFLMFYGSSSDSIMKAKDPVKLIRDAIAQALVYYYPLAGRLKEGPNGRLVVDCSGEGVLFIEGDADITLLQLGDAIQPPCQYLEDFLYDVPGSAGIVGCPLVLIQVTRLLCGGFIFGIRWNHTIADAVGMFKFLNTIAGIARGATAPSPPPVWQREILNARNPPQVNYAHHEFDEISDTNSTIANMFDDNNMVHKSLFFGPREISSIQYHLPPHLRSTSTFLVLTASLWRCRTIALQLDPNDIVRMAYMVGVSGKGGIKLPAGYYGNAFFFPVALSKAEQLCKSPLEYALSLVKEIKNRTHEEYVRSAIDLMVIKGRREYRSVVRDFVIADISRVPFEGIDFGWGKAVYGGPAGIIGNASFFAQFKNSRGENGIVIQISLPRQVMERFEKALAKMIYDGVDDQHCIKATGGASSKL